MEPNRHSEAGNDAVSECRLAADVVNDFLNERIVIETSAADGIEIFIPARLVPVGFGFLEKDGSSIHTGGYDEQKDRYYIDERTYSHEESATTSK